MNEATGLPGHLAENVMHFARVLRGAGLSLGSDRIRLALEALPIAGLESRGDLDFKRAFIVPERPLVCRRERSCPVFGEGEKLLQVPNPNRSSSGQVELLVPEASEHDEPFAGTRNRDVKPPFATRAVKRTEVHRDAAAHVWSIGEREQHHVTLFTLDTFEVLDQNGFLRVIAKMPL